MFKETRLQKIKSSLKRIRRETSDLFGARIWVRDFFFPHNVVHCKDLPRSWIDRDDLMFHVMFQILVDFVELEQPYCDYEQKFKLKRFVDLPKMKEYLEHTYNTPEGRASFYWEQASVEDKAKIDKETHQRYLIDLEVLYLYEWYKNKNYELDTWGLHESCDTQFKFINGTLVRERRENTKGIFLTINEIVEIEDEHRLICDRMLQRILAIRRNLWT